MHVSKWVVKEKERPANFVREKGHEGGLAKRRPHAKKGSWQLGQCELAGWRLCRPAGPILVWR